MIIINAHACSNRRNQRLKKKKENEAIGVVSAGSIRQRPSSSSSSGSTSVGDVCRMIANESNRLEALIFFATTNDETLAADKSKAIEILRRFAIN